MTKPHVTVDLSELGKNPYAMVGAAEITAAVSKTVDRDRGFRYRFNLYALRQQTGQVERYFDANDLVGIVKTAHVLGLFLLDEGWLQSDERERVRSLVSRLDEAFERYSPIGPMVREAIHRASLGGREEGLRGDTPRGAHLSEPPSARGLHVCA